MSHWSSYKIKIDHIKASILERACQDLGVGLNSSLKQVRSDRGNAAVDGVLYNIDSKRVLPLGLKYQNQDATLEVVGDFYQTGLSESTFLTQLLQSYRKYQILDMARLQGWEPVMDSDGNLALSQDENGNLSFDVKKEVSYA